MPPGLLSRSWRPLSERRRGIDHGVSGDNNSYGFFIIGVLGRRFVFLRRSRIKMATFSGNQSGGIPLCHF
jgi:hypothetical protein